MLRNRLLALPANGLEAEQQDRQILRAVAGPIPSVTLEVDLESEHGTASLGFDAASSLRLLGTVHWHAMSTSLRMRFVSERLSGLLDALERLLGHRLQPTAVLHGNCLRLRGNARDDVITLRVHGVDSAYNTSLTLSVRTQPSLARFLLSCQPPMAPCGSGLELSLRVQAGTRHVPAALVTEMKRGDVLLLRDTGPGYASLKCGHWPVSLVVAKEPVFLAELRPGFLIVTSLPSLPALDPSSEPVPEHGHSFSPTLELSVRMGTLGIRLDELAALRVGSTLATSLDVEQPVVEIFHGDRRLGFGVLVALDNVLGVEIREWAVPDD